MQQFLQVKIGADIGDLSKKMADANRAISNLKQPVVNAGATLTNFNRIVQDAPFGLIGIQNNIEPLFTSFRQLKEQAGGTGAALKALASTFAGPAGVIFAISAVTSFVTTLVQKYGSLDNAIKALTASNDVFSQKQLALVGIQKEANKNAGEEIAKLTVLNAVATDTAASLNKRREAAKELVKTYGTYLPKISEEAILNNQAADAINRAKDAIIGKALAQASEQKLAEVGAKILDLRLKRNDELNRELRLASEIERIESEQEENGKKRIVGQPKLNTAISVQVGLLNDARNNIADINSELKVQEELFKTLTKLAVEYSRSTAPGSSPAPKVPIAKVAPDIKIDPARAGINQTAADIEQLRNFAIDNGINIPINVDVPKDQIDRLYALGKAANDVLNLQKYQEMAKKFRALLNEGLAQPLSDFLFNFLDKGKLEFKQFADSAISNIKRIIAQLVASKILQYLGDLFLPGAGTAAGVIGKILPGLVGSMNPVINIGALSGVSIGVTVTGNLRGNGTELIGVITNASASISRVNGQLRPI